MAVTIKDVAKQANVAPSTVSRVISDSPRISEKTKKKVRKVMEEMGYYINHNARNLVQKSTQTIGIVMKNSTSASLHDPFFPEVLRGISAYCNQQDFNISITTGESEEAIFNDVVKMVQGKRVDGLIVSYSKKDDKVVPYLVDSGIPFVVVGKPIGKANEIMSVDNDNVQAAKEATEYLIRLGHQKIGFISEQPDYEVSIARLTGYQQAMQLHQLKPDPNYVRHVDTKEPMKDMVEELVDNNKLPTGFVVTDDIAALNLLLCLREKNISVPEDVSIISFNNTIISKLATPPLTSIDTQIYQLGYESAKCLIDEIKTPSMFKKTVIIPTIIEERESCKKIVALAE
ncbi:LacI family DNA-binding transcriptional regulator [Mesobacillus maritimus]|uniref:LacI family DNA-binding transcriptional regulator n=1 Tax=Mesobacillus maritimus TaxID=1643336 RepID=UPI00203EABA0|nr:LacI family DNA-binding transcriptional regulator [Mesobacillus maritimus]MCM3585327.1 LacI family DNA-binding transcriptional regulator [Mesobacillus maritimus]MCM3668208.1 LacI family DNA-binding transcriptional regulator [Mesobacillus maritimus]